ncbi:MAG: hypothetical protein K6F22_05685 [Prevotella sp.]|nr:hypothetical protein [Prevotella sp.]
MKEKKINLNVDSGQMPKAFLGQSFMVECIKSPSGVKTFIVRGQTVQGGMVVHTLGNYKELCQFFDAL